MYDFIAFDVETTGVDAARDSIVEVGAVEFRNGLVGKSFCTLVYPDCPIPAEASRIHGITDDMVAGKPRIEEVLEQFADFCGESLLAAHNASFDVKFLAGQVRRYEVKAPKGLVLDTYSISKQAVPEVLNHRLISLVKHYKIPSSAFHRAQADAVYCGKVLVKLIEQLSEKGRKIPLQNLINLSGGELRFPQLEPRAKQLGLLGGF